MPPPLLVESGNNVFSFHEPIAVPPMHHWKNPTIMDLKLYNFFRAYTRLFAEKCLQLPLVQSCPTYRSRQPAITTDLTHNSLLEGISIYLSSRSAGECIFAVKGFTSAWCNFPNRRAIQASATRISYSSCHVDLIFPQQWLLPVACISFPCTAPSKLVV